LMSLRFQSAKHSFQAKDTTLNTTELTAKLP